MPHAEYCSCGGTGTREYFRTARAVSTSSSASSSLSSDEKWPIQWPLELSNDVRAVKQLHNGFAMYRLYACYTTAIQRLYTGYTPAIYWAYRLCSRYRRGRCNCHWEGSAVETRSQRRENEALQRGPELYGQDGDGSDLSARTEQAMLSHAPGS